MMRGVLTMFADLIKELKGRILNYLILGIMIFVFSSISGNKINATLSLIVVIFILSVLTDVGVIFFKKAYSLYQAYRILKKNSKSEILNKQEN